MTIWLVKHVYYSPMHGCLYTCTICKLRLDNQSFTLYISINFEWRERLFIHAIATRWPLFALFNLQILGTERAKWTWSYDCTTFYYGTMVCLFVLNK